MTEAEWLNGTDPLDLLVLLRDKASQRKLRLFACACCRRVEGLLADERSRRALALAERFADGRVGREEFEAAALEARKLGGPAATATWTEPAHEVAWLWANRTAFT